MKKLVIIIMTHLIISFLITHVGYMIFEIGNQIALSGSVSNL